MSLDRQRLSAGPFQLYRSGKGLVADRYWLFVGMTTVGAYVGSAVPLYPLIGAMLYGVFLALRAKERGRELRFGLLFRGFDMLGETIVPSLAYGLTLWGSLLVIFLPLALAGSAFQERGQEELELLLIGTGGALIGLASILIWLPFTFAFQLVLDRELSGMAAVAESWRAVRENLPKVFLVHLIATFLYLLGALACCLGWMLVLPLIAGAQWKMYREIYPDLGNGLDAELWAREAHVPQRQSAPEDWSSQSGSE